PEHALVQRTAGVDEGESVAGQPFENEALSTEESDAEFLLESDSNAHSLRRAKKRILLGDEFSAEFAQWHRQDFSGIGCAEGDTAFPAGLVLISRHEERFSGQKAAPRPEQCANESSVLLRPIAEDRLHRDAFLHEHHRA